MPNNIEEQLERHMRVNRRATPAKVAEAIEVVTKTSLSVQALAKLFGITAPTARNRLVNCPMLESRSPRGDSMGTIPYYDFQQAAPYLVSPKMTPAEILRHVQTADLPPQFQKQFWDANLAKQRYEEQAGQLWRTEKVQQLLGDTFQALKFAMQLWVDTIEQETQITNPQREVLQGLVDGLQQEMYDSLIRLLQQTETGPALEEVSPPTKTHSESKKRKNDLL